jgi:hypothetical protein
MFVRGQDVGDEGAGFRGCGKDLIWLDRVNCRRLICSIINDQISIVILKTKRRRWSDQIKKRRLYSHFVPTSSMGISFTRIISRIKK